MSTMELPMNRSPAGSPNGPPSRSRTDAGDGSTQEQYLTFDSLGLSADLVQTVADEGVVALQEDVAVEGLGVEIDPVPGR